MQIDCYGFEASSQWFRRKELEVYHRDGLGRGEEQRRGPEVVPQGLRPKPQARGRHDTQAGEASARVPTDSLLG